MKYKLGIIGSRSWPDIYVVKNFVKSIKDEDWILVSGGCKDSPDAWAEEQFINLFPEREKIIHHADWKTYGKRAGLIRNPYISQDSNFLVCFWNPDSRTHGCIDTCKHTQKLKKPGIIITPKKQISAYININPEKLKGILNGRISDFFVC